MKNEIPESSLDSRKVEIEIAQNCQAVIKMIKDLDKHNQRQINEMERDLEARKQKELGENGFYNLNNEIKKKLKMKF